MKVKKLFKFLLLACLVSISCITLNTNSKLQAQVITLDKKIPKEILPCLPMNKKKPDRDPIIEGAARYQGKDYYVIHLLYETASPFEDDPDPHYQGGRFAVTLDEIGCLNLNDIYDATEYSFTSLTGIVPQPVAQQMALDNWKEILAEKGSKEKLKDYILESTKPGPWQMYLFEEDLWALKQLGLDLPDSVLSEKPDLLFNY